MAAEQTHPGAHPYGIPRASKTPSIWGRPLAIATAVVFCISLGFPVVAGLSKDTSSFPKWWGVLDVGIAFLLAALAIAVLGLAQGHVDKPVEAASYRAYRILIHGIFALLVVFFLFGDRIVWINCLTGFAWRSWLLLYSLPAWLTALRMTTDLSGSRRIASEVKTAH
jgi:hypothetical protein